MLDLSSCVKDGGDEDKEQVSQVHQGELFSCPITTTTRKNTWMEWSSVFFLFSPGVSLHFDQGEAT